MTQEQLAAILEAASARPDGEWSKLPDGRTLTLYAAHDGVQLTVPRVEAVAASGQLVRARTAKQEIFIFALSDLFAASTESANAPTRKAGFL
jgi:hypothetical protein